MYKVYVPSYCYIDGHLDELKNDGPNFGSKVIGVFDTEKKAVDALIKLLVSESVIEANFQVKLLKDIDQDFACYLEDYNMKVLTKYLIETMVDFDCLKTYCSRFNDSCYEDKWFIKMDVFPIR
jgi:hypothetical protein